MTYLRLAAEEEKAGTWRGLVRLACQYGASARPLVTAAEFNHLGACAVREVFDPEASQVNSKS